MRALAYKSTAMPMLSSRDIDSILIDAKNVNGAEGISGVLLYDGKYFFQYIEGESASIDYVFKRIVASRKHRDVEVVFDQAVDARYFWRWTMACRNVTESVISRMEAANWSKIQSAVGEDRLEIPGIGLLSDFWGSAE